jgi:type IV secretion system protein VirB4
VIQLPPAVKKAATRHVSGSTLIPYGTIITDHLVKLSGGAGLLGTWQLGGIPFETVDEGEILARKEALHHFLRALGGGSFAVWTHKIRRVVHERLQGVADNSFCRELTERYYDTFETHRQMATELYLSILYRPPQQKIVNLFGRAGSKQLSEIQQREQEGIAAFEDVAKQLDASLRRYEPERLGTYERNGVVYSQHLSFLAYLLNGVWEPVPLRRCPLSTYLLSSRLHFSDRTGMVEIWHPSGTRKFAGLLDIQEYPGFSEPGMTNGMLYGESEYIETQSFSFLGKRDGLKYLERQRNHLISGEDAATREIAQFGHAAEDLQSGLIDVGEYHYSIRWRSLGRRWRRWRRRAPWRGRPFRTDPASRWRWWMSFRNVPGLHNFPAIGGCVLGRPP